MNIGLVHPGEMGASVGAALRHVGHDVFCVASGRSNATRERAFKAGLSDAGSLNTLVEQTEVLFSICPPSAALEMANTVLQLGFGGIYVDANAIAPKTALTIATRVEAGNARYVDGGIIGAPVALGSQTCLYLSGLAAPMVAELFQGSMLKTVVLDQAPVAASALKMAYAAWSKGSAALLLSSLALARASGVEAALLQEWQDSSPELLLRVERAAKRAGVGSVRCSKLPQA
jgi:3-hydroxyisobutyrate dehydrogenase-like beta-hydroxyacid dehydrogenase